MVDNLPYEFIGFGIMDDSSPMVDHFVSMNS